MSFTFRISFIINVLCYECLCEITLLQHIGRKGIGKAIFPLTVHDEVLIYKVPKMKKKTGSNQRASHSTDTDNTKKHVYDELQKKQETNAVAAVDKIQFPYVDNIKAFNTFLLEGNITKTLCQNNFCCNFTVEIVKNDPKTRYRLGVFNNMRNFGSTTANVSVCGVMQCSNQLVESCGSTQKSETVFSNIDIFATYYNYDKNLIMPSILDSDLYPFQVTDWTYDEHPHNDHVHVNLALTNKRNNLLTFGLFSRNFVNGSPSITVSFNIVAYFTALLMVL